jgi:hypothetical protein
MKVDLFRAFDKEFRVEAMKNNISIIFFPTMQNLKFSNIIELEFFKRR